MQRLTPLRMMLRSLTTASAVASILALSACAGSKPVPDKRKAAPVTRVPVAPKPAPAVIKPAGPPVKMNWQACGPVDAQLRDQPAALARARQNDACAQYAVGLAYDNGLGTPVNDVEAAMWYQRASDLGQAEAQNNLGLLYLDGHGVKKDLDKARELLLLAERNGMSAATLNLGLIYADETGPYHDDVRALQYFRRAADLGLGDAQYNVGMFYRHGRAVPVDNQQALQWYQKAAAQNIANAQVNLGAMYYQGIGLPKPDKLMAAQWYRRAALNGVPQAQFDLGLMLSQGEAGPKNFDQALLWFSEAAQQGYADAQTELAQLYAAGQGTPKNLFLAYYWQRLYVGGRADKTGEPRDRMTAMEKALSPEQIQQVIHKIWLYDGAHYGHGKFDKTALQEWQQRNQDFLDANRRNAGIKLTLSGLQYQLLKPGTGRTPINSDKVTVNYRLSLIDGDLVDASAARPAPVKFQIDKVWAGLSEGLRLTRVGGKTRLFIPSNLAYADRGAGLRIPPWSTLVIELELTGIDP